MTDYTYTGISDNQVDQDSPLDETLFRSLRDDPLGALQGAAGAPINWGGWHPYDADRDGDGKTGIIWSHAVHGSVTAIVTPTFEAGFEYRILATDIQHNNPSVDRPVFLELYWGASLAWSLAQTVTPGWTHAGNKFAATDVLIAAPRLSRRVHTLSYAAGLFNDTSPPTGEALARAYHNATAQGVTQARLTIGGNSFTAGQVRLLRSLSKI